MDELKVLQNQVNDRPSTTDVSNMMEGISLTFRKYVLFVLFVLYLIFLLCCCFSFFLSFFLRCLYVSFAVFKYQLVFLLLFVGTWARMLLDCALL
jgi:hypothetical protein